MQASPSLQATLLGVKTHPVDGSQVSSVQRFPSSQLTAAPGWQAPPEPKRTHYFRSSHHIPIFSPGEANVNFEIHWNLASPRWQVDADELIERSLPLDVGGRKALRLEDHDFVAHLLLHHFTHYFERRMKWAVDMHLIARQPDFDWQRPVEQVKAWGAAGVFWALAWTSVVRGLMFAFWFARGRWVHGKA